MKKLGLITAAATLFAPAAMAGNRDLVQSTGIEDETLFLILTVVALLQLIILMVLSGAFRSVISQWENIQRNARKAAGVVALLVASSVAFAGSGTSYSDTIKMDDTGFLAMLAINGLLFLCITFVSMLTFRFQAKLFPKEAPATAEEKALAKESYWDRLLTKLHDAAPIEQEEDVLMHHEYDGIRELDNKLPPWWVWGFAISIVFGIVYVANYHVFRTAELQDAEYLTEMKQAEEDVAAYLATQANNVDESNVVILTEISQLASGNNIYQSNCATCHGKAGEGLVGPNFVDDYWLHGGTINEVFKTVKYGVPEKGMISWKATLSPVEMQEVSSYILSLRGTNPENQKEPQGTLYVPEGLEEELEAVVDTIAGDTALVELSLAE